MAQRASAEPGTSTTGVVAAGGVEATVAAVPVELGKSDEEDEAADTDDAVELSDGSGIGASCCLVQDGSKSGAIAPS